MDDEVLTVQLYFIQSDQYCVAENLRLIAEGMPANRVWPTPMIPPAVWYRGRGSYRISLVLKPIISPIPAAAKKALPTNTLKLIGHRQLTKTHQNGESILYPKLKPTFTLSKTNMSKAY